MYLEAYIYIEIRIRANPEQFHWIRNIGSNHHEIWDPDQGGSERKSTGSETSDQRKAKIELRTGSIIMDLV